jgi:hypothetical protein
MKERSKGKPSKKGTKSIKSTYVERAEEEEKAIGGTFALSQMMEVAYRVHGIDDQVHKGWYT